VLLAAVLWSLGGAFIKELELHPLTIVFYRSFFAYSFFALFVRRGRWVFGWPLLVSVASYTAAISSFVWANKLTTAANAIVLQYTAPIFVFLFLRIFFVESIHARDVSSLIAGMVGVAVIFVGTGGGSDATGVSVAVLSGFLFAVYMTNLRALREMAPVNLTLANNLACWLILSPFIVPHAAVSAAQIAALVAMGVIQLGLPYFLFSKGLETLSLQEASLIVLAEPVLNPIWVALVVGEIPAPATILGGTIIVGGLAWRYRAAG
jgi:drug/metabolite transporter (DMT)-like permease